MERIVRVGTHIKQDNFQKRIRCHYNGNKNGSVFRKHLGGAIIARDNQNDPRLSSWLAKGTNFPETEGRVNELLRKDFGFRRVRVDDPNERLRFEKCLIATLSGCEYCRHSANWLGIHAKDPRIEQSGLWNIRHTRSVSPLLDGDWFSRFEQLLKSANEAE